MKSGVVEFLSFQIPQPELLSNYFLYLHHSLCLGTGSKLGITIPVSSVLTIDVRLNNIAEAIQSFILSLCLGAVWERQNAGSHEIIPQRSQPDRGALRFNCGAKDG